MVVTLGHIAFQAYLTARRERGLEVPSPAPRFGHGVSYQMGGITLIGSYHPSQQNTFTGRLTKDMFQAVFQKARTLVDK